MMKSKYLVILGMIGVVAVFCGDVVVGQCPGMEGLITECGVYVQKFGPQMNPSQQCCVEINNADVSCLCHHLTKSLMKLIDMQKVAYVADSCGRPIPSGTKCGDSHVFNHFPNSKSSGFAEHQVPRTQILQRPIPTQ